MDNELEKVIMEMYEYKDGQLSDVEIVQDIYKRLHNSIDDVIRLKEENERLHLALAEFGMFGKSKAKGPKIGYPI